MIHEQLKFIRNRIKLLLGSISLLRAISLLGTNLLMCYGLMLATKSLLKLLGNIVEG